MRFRRLSRKLRKLVIRAMRAIKALNLMIMTTRSTFLLITLYKMGSKIQKLSKMFLKERLICSAYIIVLQRIYQETRIRPQKKSIKREK